jgi:hypothetical protein
VSETAGDGTVLLQRVDEDEDDATEDTESSAYETETASSAYETETASSAYETETESE